MDSRLAVVNGVVRYLLVSGRNATYAHWRLPGHGYTLCRNRIVEVWYEGERLMCSACARAREQLEARLVQTYLTTPFFFTPPKQAADAIIASMENVKALHW